MSSVEEHMQQYNQSLIQLLYNHKVKLMILVFIAVFGYVYFIPYLEKVQKQYEYKKKHGSQLVLKDELNKKIIKFDTVLDVRTPEEYEKGHVKNSIHVHYTDISPKQNGSLLLKKGLKKKDRILVYCKSGRRASIARQLLIEKHQFYPKKIYITNEPYHVIQSSLESDDDEISV